MIETCRLPEPGRIMVDAASGLRFQDEFEYDHQCADRERNGFNSGMGEIVIAVERNARPIIPRVAIAPF